MDRRAFNLTGCARTPKLIAEKPSMRDHRKNCPGRWVDKWNREDSAMRVLRLCPALSALVLACPAGAFQPSSSAIDKAGIYSYGR